MINKIYNGHFQKAVALLVSTFIVINCTTAKQIEVINERDELLSSKTIVLHSRDNTFLFYNVKRNEKGLKGVVTSSVPASNKSTELHIFLNSEINIPLEQPFPTEFNIDSSAIKKIEVYESNTVASLMLGSLILVGFFIIAIFIWEGSH